MTASAVPKSERASNPGRELHFTPGFHSGLLTLVSRVDGAFAERNRSRAALGYGWWNAQCQCGAMVVVHTRDIRRHARAAYSCPSCPPPPRKPCIRLTCRSPQHIGAVYGRMFVHSWSGETGWTVECLSCGEVETYRKIQEVMHRGARPCPTTLTTLKPPTPVQL